ncbi:hypothetical protein [Chelativorans sp. YIM 93263]|uniref:hypothetical protein n=1 Tax=Chelativorans sp. YIM 93263 TaxID=2906648 RepID=UPI002377DF82|nr:hypothetical protein [Chelativorans sp. YIM 93263]
MAETKPWYLSRTIWASIVTVVSGMGGLFGLPVEDIDRQALTDTLLQAVIAVSGLFAILGRVRATSRIA